MITESQNQTADAPANRLKPWQLAVTLALLCLYGGYIYYIVLAGQGAVDYETFMDLGRRLLSGQEVYIENSYYPLPYVMIFALFAWLPRPVSIIVWHLGVVASALIISGGQPWSIAFGPVFAHVIGGQTSVLAMLGLWGYRRNVDAQRARGGVWLALTLFKPQLGIVPTLWALVMWWRSWRQTRTVPRQFWVWLIAALVIYIPSFAIMPDWPVRWLQQPRPLFERAMSGLVPRTLVVLGVSPVVFWVAIIVAAALVLFLIMRYQQGRLTLDTAMLGSFIVSPLVHDYDLIQLVPLLDKPKLQWGAVLLSIPTWVVVLLAYGNDQAWFVVTIIAPGLLVLKLILDRRKALSTAPE